ncbi:MAG: hypothetical protein ACI4T6_03615 [Candidatus Flemingiibacterium sp.]
MDMYTEPYDSDTPKERSLPAKIIIGTLKAIGILIIVSVFATIFIRLQLWKTPKEFRDFAWTDEALAKYSENGGLTVGLQEPYTEFDENGYYHISDVSFAPDAGEIQLTVRYNSRSTINKLMEVYGLTERPTSEVFVYILQDDDGNQYTSYRFAARSKPLSDFRRIIFDGVSFEGVENLYLYVYYGEDVDDKAEMSAVFTVYETSRYIEKTNPEPSEMTFTLSDNPAYINKNNK